MIDKSRYNYNFSDLERAMSDLKAGHVTVALASIKKELNNFMKEATCLDVIYTKNFDKFFFGMCVMPVIDQRDVPVILADDKPYLINKYCIEIDSKLLEIGLTKQELVAVLLHEVGHVVNDLSAVKDVRHAIDDYMADHKESLDIKESIHFREILAYGIKDTIRKTRSIFTRNNDEILADEFVFMCGYGEPLQSAFEKICMNAKTVNSGVDCSRLMVLNWSLYLYKNMKTQRISALSTLNKCKRFTASKLEKREIETAIQSLNKIDDIAMRESTFIYESVIQEGSTLFSKLQRKGLRGLEEDIFEFEMRIKNTDTEDEALLLMRQINARISILDDYLISTQGTDEITEKEREKCSKLIDRYDRLREELVKKSIYSKKNYGIWVDYNHLGMAGVGDMYR